MGWLTIENAEIAQDAPLSALLAGKMAIDDRANSEKVLPYPYDGASFNSNGNTAGVWATIGTFYCYIPLDCPVNFSLCVPIQTRVYDVGGDTSLGGQVRLKIVANTGPPQFVDGTIYAHQTFSCVVPTSARGTYAAIEIQANPLDTLGVYVVGATAAYASLCSIRRNP